MLRDINTRLSELSIYGNIKQLFSTNVDSWLLQKEIAWSKGTLSWTLFLRQLAITKICVIVF